MGKRKKNSQNVVKLDLSDTNLGKRKVFPVIVGHSSKDGRRAGQTVHQIPTSEQTILPPTFDPSPVVNNTWDESWDDAWDNAFPEADDTTGEPNSQEPVRPCFISLQFALTPHSIVGGPSANLVRGPR